MANIQIIGGGAIGLLLAGRLAASGARVCLRTRTRAQADELAARGVTVLSAPGEADVRAAVDAAALDDVWDGPAGDTLLAVKQTALTPAFVDRMDAVLPPGASVTAFCNGIGHTDLLASRLPGRSVFAAVTTEGALRVDATTVRHTGRGEIRLGPAPLFERGGTVFATGEESAAAPLAAMLKQAGFSATLSNDMAQRMLRKLLGNAVVNPLTALLRVQNGALVRTPERLTLMRTLFDETLSVLEASGLRSEDDLWEEVLDLCARTAANRSSMLQDVLAGRPTEIASINGAVARLAAQHGKEAPYNESLVALVSAMRGDDREG
ncbi:ketopantoate reductase family protein [Cohnella sp. GCM10012308]|uniref:ketopantoate reductase family protein n=1 Tax=Cohnella sp. GCM10012308 TaxID=3317329 RepID=UPI00360F2340